MTPGVYTVPSAQYHADDLGCDAPMLSASLATILLRESPKHAYARHPKLGGFIEEPSETFDLGTAAHSMILEGNESSYAIIEANDWRTNAAKDARAAARAAGKTPLLAKQVERVRAMSAAVRAQLAEFADAPAPLTNGKPEQTLVWQEDDLVCCKARLDWLHDDLLTIDDLKTTAKSASPQAWTRSVYGMGGDVQAAMYLRGLSKVAFELHDPRLRWNASHRTFRWIVVENSYPYATSVCTLSPDALGLAHQKVQLAIDIWRECLRTGYWPGYPLRTVSIDAPKWEALAAEELEIY